MSDPERDIAGPTTVDFSKVSVLGLPSPSYPLQVPFSSGFKLKGAAGVLSFSTTDVGNVGAGEDILIAYNVGDGDLSIAGETVESMFAVNFAVNVNLKRVRLRIGNGGGFSVIYDSTAQMQSAGSLILDCTIILISAPAAQRCVVRAVGGGLFEDEVQYTDLSEDFGSTLQLRLTAEAVADNDIVHKMSRVMFRSF